jgi:hypothetical protein
MHYCGMCGVDLNLQLSLGCRRLLDPLPIVDLANQTYLHSLLTVLTDAECYEGELSGDGTLCFGCANSLEQLEHLQRQVRQKKMSFDFFFNNENTTDFVETDYRCLGKSARK